MEGVCNGLLGQMDKSNKTERLKNEDYILIDNSMNIVNELNSYFCKISDIVSSKMETTTDKENNLY